MAKSFKKFRNDFDDSDWDEDESEIQSKEHRLQERRTRRKVKATEKLAAIAEDDGDE
jgi:hypothetical protein